MITASNDTLSAWVSEIYIPAKIPNVSETTSKHWRQAVKWFGEAIERCPTISDLQGDVIERAMATLAARGMARSTVDVVSMKITALWRFLAARGIISTWPTYPRARATDNGIKHRAKPRALPKRRRPREKERWQFDHPELLAPFRERHDKSPILIPAIFDNSTPLRTLAAMYADRKLFDASQITVSHYETAIRVSEKLLGREPIVSDLTEENVIGVMRLTLRAGRTPHTANCYRSKLVALWNFACRRNLLKEWPDLKKLTEPHKIPFVWMPNQMELIFDSIRRQTWHVGEIPAANWFRAFILTMWDSAERLGALLQIRWEDIQGKWLVVPAMFRKWKREDKAHELHDDTIDALKQIAEPQRSTIFSWPWCRATIFSRYAKILLEAGLTPCRKAMFHAVRRTVASNYQQAGGDASDLLGHGDKKTARESYLSPLIVRPPQASELIYRPDGPPESKRIEAEGGAR